MSQEKDELRAQLAQQVDDFLRRGGAIRQFEIFIGARQSETTDWKALEADRFKNRHAKRA